MMRRLVPKWWSSKGARFAFLISLVPWMVATIVFTFDWNAIGKVPVKVHASPAGFGTTANGAADGIVYAQLGYHSAPAQRPAHLTLDLGSLRDVDRVKVFGRGDCCFAQSIPLELAVSDDGARFRKAALRERPFTQYQPWVVEIAQEARFLRLSTKPGRFLVVSEVEVYAD